MKISFFHDHLITESNSRLFTAGGLNDAVLKRYSDFGELSLVCRNDQSREIGGLTEIKSEKAIRYYSVPNLSTLRFSNYFKAYRIIYSVIVESDAVIIRLPSLIGFFAGLICLFKKKQFLVELVGCPWDSYYNYSLTGKLVAVPFYLLTRIIVYFSKNVLYVTESFLQRRYPTKANHTIGCSDVVLDPTFNTFASLDQTRVRDNIVIGMIGALSSKYKGFDVALRAIFFLKSKYGLQITLEIVGGGLPGKWIELITKLKLENNVNIKGSLSHPKGVFKWLKTLDIYIQPSKQEGLPRALVEAMYSSCACIGSNVGGIPELLPAEYLHNPSDHILLGQLIYKLLDQDEKRKLKEYCFQRSRDFETDKLSTIRFNFYRTFFNEIKN